MKLSSPAATLRIRKGVAAWATLAGLTAGAVAALSAVPAASPTRAAPILVLRLRSVIHPIVAELIKDTLNKADREGATAVILELDTPGGLAASTHDITTAMLEARTPVVVYVAPGGARAASAGFFILMAADVAAMSPGTNTGAAHPVGGGGETIEGKLGEKIEQDSAATIRAFAVRNGRPPAVAEQAVLTSRSFTAEEALQAHLIDLVVPDLPALLHALDGRRVHKPGQEVAVLATARSPLERVDPSSWRALLAALAQPDIAYLLLTLGGLGLFFELMHPGAVLPGVVGAIFLILAFFALSVLPVNYAGVALIFLALVLFVAEVKVASHGLLTLAGLSCLVLGSLMLFKSPEPALRVSLSWIAMLAAVVVAVMLFLLRLVRRAFRLPVQTGKEGMLHAQGRARSPLAPRGKVFVHGELWDAVSHQPVGVGEPVEVLAVHDMTLEVQRIGEPHVEGVH
jgi:membrane-bound serine protease (ClpP class)